MLNKVGQREQRRNFLAKMAARYGWEKGAEIGCLVGWTHFYLLDNVAGLSMYAVDSWKDHSGSCQYAKQIENRAEFYQKAGKYNDRCTILEMDSLEAAARVQDESLDFVFIDGDHTYEGCKRDILAWMPKIKRGGWITGHDYHEFPGVKQAVDELLSPVSCAADFTDEVWACRRGETDVTVVCIKHGDKYGSEYVNKLYRMVQRHIHMVSFDFVCITDNPQGIDSCISTLKPMSNKPGWWQKIDLFRAYLPGIITPKILFLDLDVLVMSCLDEMIESDKDFVICRDWPPELKPEDKGYNSSAFLLKVGARAKVWNDFGAEAMKMFGDQDWITSCLPGEATFPYDWTPSYKLRKLQNACPPEAKIVLFEGRPKPPECGGWVKENWGK